MDEVLIIYNFVHHTELCGAQEDEEKREDFIVLKEEISDFLVSIGALKKPQAGSKSPIQKLEETEPLSELPNTLTSQGNKDRIRRRVSRDVIGLDLAVIPQTRVRSYEIFPVLQTSKSTLALSRKKSPRARTRTRKPVRSNVTTIGKLDNSSMAEIEEIHTRKRRESAPDTPTRHHRASPSVGTPYTNQRLLQMSSKSPSSSPLADKQKSPLSDELKVLLANELN